VYIPGPVADDTKLTLPPRQSWVSATGVDRIVGGVAVQLGAGVAGLDFDAE
jgi:hypothetical protein